MMKTPAAILHLVIAAFVAAVVGLSAGSAAAEEVTMKSWMPDPPKAIGGDKCDEDPKWMRKWHMNVLNHKRDETVHEGIRTKQYSLARCISCHAVKGDDGKFVTVKDERHFCRTCHDYAAVKMDCFTCHASRPGAEDQNAATPGAGNPHAGLSSGMGTDLAALREHFAGEKK